MYNVCSYAYVTASGAPNERVIHALENVGWPVVQGGLSTILGMVSVVNVSAYVITTFFKVSHAPHSASGRSCCRVECTRAKRHQPL